jgi:nucleoid DNA-binding protein
VDLQRKSQMSKADLITLTFERTEIKSSLEKEQAYSDVENNLREVCGEIVNRYNVKLIPIL